jgi:hypothetical protein
VDAVLLYNASLTRDDLELKERIDAAIAQTRLLVHTIHASMDAARQTHNLPFVPSCPECRQGGQKHALPPTADHRYICVCGARWKAHH